MLQSHYDRHLRAVQPVQWWRSRRQRQTIAFFALNKNTLGPFSKLCLSSGKLCLSWTQQDSGSTAAATAARKAQAKKRPKVSQNLTLLLCLSFEVFELCDSALG